MNCCCGNHPIPHACPVCKGRRTVPPGFYADSPAGTGTGEVTCRSCGGTGIIWSYPYMYTPLVTCGQPVASPLLTLSTGFQPTPPAGG